MKKRIIVASENPVKINATKQGFQRLYPEYELEVQGVSVPSDVSAQPMTDGETLHGAVNRAYNAEREMPDADYWVGIEGGIHYTMEGYIAFAWVVIQTKADDGKARTGTFLLPPKVTQLIDKGVELGHANDQVFAEHNSKQAGGAVGSLTNGVLGRTEYYEQAVVLALVPLFNSEMYKLKM